MRRGFEGAELAGRELVVPALGPEPFPIQVVAPSPCTAACPAGVNVKAYVSLIAEGRFARALEVVRESCPLPGICGRICHHPCEAACRRGDIDQPIAIRSLKRFVADLELELPDAPPPPPIDRWQRVAVVGSGPAGLTAAYDLRRAGYPVTVFEAEPEPGGMLRYGIADYRLPPEILDREIGVLERAGIEIVTGCRVGAERGLDDLLSQGFVAALLAVGAQRGRRLGIEDEEDSPEVEDALGFLRRVNRGDRQPLRGRVLVIGGGSTAIEAARSALRLGAESVEVVYRRHRGEMPADEEEIQQAAAEGVAFRLLTAPSRVIRRRGRLRGLECLRVALGEPDASGRRRPIPIPGSEHLLPAERVLAAVGQEAALEFLPRRIRDRMASRGRLMVDDETAMTALRGVFAAGDAVSGPATVIEAIAAGHEVAGEIRRFLESADDADGRGAKAGGRRELEIPAAPPPSRERLHPLCESLAPGREFAEVEHAFSPESAVAEARRCLRCGPCAECRLCVSSCRRRHLTLSPAGAEPGSEAVLLRAGADVVAALATAWETPTPAESRAWLLPAGARFGLDGAAACDGEPVALAAARVAIDAEHCRGCVRCLEVCSFDALTPIGGNGEDAKVRVDPALCRGCCLCAAVCPTGAVRPAAALVDLAGPLAAVPETARVVLACRRRAEGVASRLAALGPGGPGFRLLPVRCVGQLDAGRLLELYRHGAGQVLVAGCLPGSCRYGFGSDLAAEQVRRARAVLEILGTDPRSIVADWAGAGEPDAPLSAMAASGGS